MPPNDVIYEVRDHVAWLTMNRPEVLNALSKGMFSGLERAIGDTSKDPTANCLVLRGAGRAFSAGLDVKEVSGFSSRKQARDFVYKLVKPFWVRWFNCEKPILSVVDGPAYGAGAEIALASDIIIASSRSTFAFSGGKVGALCCISPILGPLTMTGRKVVEMNLAGEPISAEAALTLGLASYVEDPSEIDARISKILDELRHVSPVSNASFKRIHNSMITPRLLNIAHKELLRTITSPDFSKGAAAFAQKTRARYY